ncbi:MAG TPA: type II CAAX endopeptidase family protein [Candidatus Polarisedimenticolia bacterium]|nr:type II CAAX endopeptidase family protein [Candidatus Polarisedimenticolia bacterium]
MSPRSAKARLLSTLEIALGLGFLTDALTAVLLSRISALSNPLGSVQALAAWVLLSSFFLTLLIWVLLRCHGESLRQLCLGQGGVAWRDVRLGLWLVPAIFLASYLLKSATHHSLPALYSGERNVLEELMHGPQDLGLFLVVVFLAGGFREELQRAFIIRRFEWGWGPAWLGAVLFALFFGYGHRIQGKDEAIIAGVFGLIWGALYVARKNLVAASLSHALFDAVELVRYYLWGPLRYL